MKTPTERAIARARQMGPLDVAALLLCAAHVAGQLRRLADADRDEGAHRSASRLEALAAQLNAGQVTDLETRALRQWSAELVTAAPAAGRKGGVA